MDVVVDSDSFGVVVESDGALLDCTVDEPAEDIPFAACAYEKGASGELASLMDFVGVAAMFDQLCRVSGACRTR